MNKYLYGLLVVVTTSLMGSAFAIGKVGLIYSSPILLVALRFTIAGMIMALVILALKEHIPVRSKNGGKYLSSDFSKLLE